MTFTYEIRMVRSIKRRGRLPITSHVTFQLKGDPTATVTENARVFMPPPWEIEDFRVTPDPYK